MQTLDDPDVRRAVAARVMNLQPGSRRRWGRMSPHEAMVHLSDSFRGCMGLKPVSRPRMLPMLAAAMKFFALYVPIPWPHGTKTRPEMEQGAGGTPPTEFERDRRDLMETLDQFVAPGAERTPHPIFGTMTEWEWQRWGYLHMDHHLRQFGV